MENSVDGVTLADREAAKQPHELFLVNLIFNHIFLFIAAMSASSMQVLVLIVPVISLCIIGFTLWRARQLRASDNGYLRCHWRLAASRSMAFVFLWLLGVALIGILLLVSGGDMKPQHYAVAGVTFFPLMLTVLALVLMESEALQHARNGTLPKRIIEKYPEALTQKAPETA